MQHVHKYLTCDWTTESSDIDVLKTKNFIVLSS